MIDKIIILYKKIIILFNMLFTKIHIPQPKENIIQRFSLFEKLDDGLRRKLILVSATAGYGKTTLVVDWIHSKKNPLVWYSLDESDDIFTSFLSIPNFIIFKPVIQVSKVSLFMILKYYFHIILK